MRDTSFRKPSSRLALIKYTSEGPTCTCGWRPRPASRLKVQEDRIDRHIAKVHSGRGVRL